MPFTPSDAKKHTKKARSGKAKRQWANVANNVLTKGGSDASAIRQANAVVKGGKR